MAKALVAFMYLLTREKHVSIATMHEILDSHEFKNRGIKGYRLSDKDLEKEAEEIARVLED